MRRSSVQTFEDLEEFGMDREARCFVCGRTEAEHKDEDYAPDGMCVYDKDAVERRLSRELANLEWAMLQTLASITCGGRHQWVDHSVAGPDSGTIDMTCRVCGVSYHKVLY